MGRPILTFADLLNPIRPETFFERNWEKEPLFIERSESRFYESLLTHRDVELAISSGGIRYPAIQLARDGGYFPAESFAASVQSGDKVFTGVPNLDRVRAEYQSGATVSLPAFHRAWKPLGMLAAAIEEDLDHAVHTNVYLTPGNAAGYPPHYDTHEVFILQIAGHKRWRIHKSALSLPHRTQPFDHRKHVASAPTLEVDLAPGDLLYLPRGFVHATTTADSFSVHVTLGVTVYTWVELLAGWSQLSTHFPSFRRALPPGFAGHEGVKQSLKQQLPEIIAELQRMTDYDGLLDDFAHHVRSARSSTHADFHADVAVIGPRTELKALEPGCYVVAEEGENVVLKFGGKTLVMDKKVRPTLDDICGRPRVSSSDVSRHLGSAETLTLVRLLYEEGFLSVCRPTTTRN